MSELLDRLEGWSREELIACLPRVERMATELSPNTLYPETSIVNRVLGTSIRLDDPRQLVGAAILTDLSVIAERVSANARLTESEAESLDGSLLLSLDEVLARWSVAKKSIDRYRRVGLIGRRVLDGHGRTRLMFSKAAVEGFEQRHPDRLVRAARFRRVSAPEDEKIRRLAERYHRRLRWSLNQSAKRISERFGLSHEGVRQILQRGEGSIFAESGPPSARDRLFAVRAASRGEVGSPEAVAKRWGRTKASARRAYNEGRAGLLRGLELPGPVLKAFDRPDAGEVLLGPEAVVHGLSEPGIEDIRELFAGARKRTPPVLGIETARATAMHYLRWRAAREIAGLDPTTASGTGLDRAETDLRWASLLKAELLRPHLGLVLETLESRAGQRLEEMGLGAMTGLWARAMGAASHAVDGFDPSGKGRLAGRIGLGVDRAVADRAGGSKAAGSARARRGVPRGAGLRDWTLSLDPWQGWLGIDPRLRAVVTRSPCELSDRSRRVLAMRLGLPGGGEGLVSSAEPPRTLAETAQALGTARVHVARFEREAVTEAMGVWRRTMPR
ncbi:MAG: hypothetical protein ACI89L_001206 [Phycisphaerales bacterium]|jgi:hypothetical protein